LAFNSTPRRIDDEKISDMMLKKERQDVSERMG
jgi:hypothetical protein